VLMTAALTDELSRTTPTNACCRRAETIILLRFAGAVHQQPTSEIRSAGATSEPPGVVPTSTEVTAQSHIRPIFRAYYRYPHSRIRVRTVIAGTHLPALVQ